MASLTESGIFESPPNISLMASLKILRVSLLAVWSSGERNHLNRPRIESVVEAVTVRPASAPVVMSTPVSTRAIEFMPPLLCVMTFAKSVNALNVSLYPFMSSGMDVSC